VTNRLGIWFLNGTFDQEVGCHLKEIMNLLIDTIRIDNQCTLSYPLYMAFSIRFSEEKNQLLKATRGIGFDELIVLIKDGELLADKEHISKNHPNQRIYVVRMGKYAYVVSYILNLKKNEIFLKTIYPSRKFTKQYLKKGD